MADFAYRSSLSLSGRRDMIRGGEKKAGIVVRWAVIVVALLEDPGK